jgi:hypothetical protein
VNDEFNNLAFRDATDLIQVQATFPLDVFGFFRRTKKRIRNHPDGGYGGATHREHEFPIVRHCIQ